jgi:hypothetical protein
MPRFDHKRLGKNASGEPAELRISILRGAGTAPIALPTSKGRDGLVSVIQDSNGSAWVDITATATLVAGSASGAGSVVPGANVGADDLMVFWYKFT